MIILWLLATFVTLGLGVLGERRLRTRATRQAEKLKALVERQNVYTNYNKLAGVRRIEAEETLNALRQEVTDAEAAVRGQQSELEAAEGQAPMEFHCFDRLPRAEGQLWYVAVEALDKKAGWSGVKHYALVAETPDDARKRIQERHPSPSGFAIAQPMMLSLPER